MGSKGKEENGIQGTAAGWMGLAAQIELWKQDKEKADLMGLEWMMIQNQRYKGKPTVKYVTLGSIIACSEGTQYSRIQMTQNHGIVTKEGRLPIATVEDFKQSNIVTFGLCKKCSSVGLQPCVPNIKYPWIQANNAVLAGGPGAAALLQADAVAVCSRGGMICVKEVNTSPQEYLMAVLYEQFGFDARTARIMAETYSLIEKKYPDKSNREIGWYFSRALSQVGGYNNKEMEIIGRKIETHAWKKGGGIVFEYDRQSMESWFTEELGLGKSDYLYLLQMVKLQNMMTSDPENYSYDAAEALARKYQDENEDKNNKNDATKREFASWVENMERLGERYIDEDGVIDVDAYLKRYKEIYDRYEGKGDFPHMMYTVSAGLADESKTKQFHQWTGLTTGGMGWKDSETRQDITGWLGDAIYAPEGKTSFGNDDFISDLDGDNLVHRVGEEVTLLDAIQQYYQTLPLSDEDRIEEFLENNPYDEVEAIIMERLKIKDKNGDKKETLEDLKAEPYREKYKETYDFLKRLKDHKG